ncbi:hypothetical protein PSTG_00435 [Puccinia striiformis f. sp. tritici PST-78]|uniref:Uncharacterized protein n=1 Tax=Puccinia striiformis f. sp. tritici PST-78 TaxID=1165861 RepID=A0A0L0W529_9BASI|nr:hypothetical protein PSTG_00435 [Puccinia striiformis f. sp. tritici PST-78]
MDFRSTPHQGIHTNNYVEASHRILKAHFIAPLARRCIDEVVQVLTDKVHTLYLRTQLQVAHGIKQQQTNKFQTHAKARSKDGYTKQITFLLGVRLKSACEKTFAKWRRGWVYSLR